MVILFLVSANVGTVVAAAAIWSAYSLWYALVFAPLGGCAAGALALLLGGWCQGTARRERDEITDQVSSLTGMLEASKQQSQGLTGSLSQPSANQAA
jgi:hypothetical protein